MTKKTAIRMIREQKAALDNYPSGLWLITMAAYLDKIFGQDSYQYKALEINARHLDIQSAEYDNNILRLKNLCDAWEKYVNEGLMRVQDETKFERRLFSFLAGLGGGAVTAIVANIQSIGKFLSQLFHR